MAEFLIMLKNVLVFVALAIPGFLMAKKKVLQPQDCNALSQILIYVAMPFLVFYSALDITLNGKTALEFLLVAVLTGIGQLGGCLLTSFLPGLPKDKPQRNVMRFAMVFGNNGFLGLPLVAALFSESLPITVAYSAIIGIVSNLLILIVGNHMIVGKKATFSFKSMVTNPVLIAFSLGAIANLLKITDRLPEVETYAVYLKNLVTPVSMFIIGIKFGEMKLKHLICDRKLYYVTFVRLVLFPALVAAILLLVRIVLPVSNPLILALFIGFAMPTAAMTTTLAVQSNIPGNSATGYVLGTTLFSVVTLPVLYSLLQIFL